ncbi:MAG: hypothetical protein E7013_05885 [Alphaproteobacteria bacterium]|nr:hypothetical protein [Alphaproteobacteria bacterium]
MKKNLILLLTVFAIVLSFSIFFYSKKEVKDTDVLPSQKVVQITALDDYLNLENAPLQWTDVQTTEELEKLFEGVKFDKIPKIFVRRFPDDFSQKGYPVLLAKTLLPHILRQNQLLTAERNAFLVLVDKLKNKQPFTQAEEDFWNKLIFKYEVLNPDKIGQQATLFQRLDRISPSLAIAQSIEATQNAKIHLDMPFDVRRWNDKKEYDFVQYDDLASAVADYALELNRGYSYLKFHMLRAEQRPANMPLHGRIFARGLTYYKIEDINYVNKLLAVFDYYDFQKLDEATFVEEN